MVSVVPVSSGSFDCADHDGAVICFAQDDGGVGLGEESGSRFARWPTHAMRLNNETA